MTWEEYVKNFSLGENPDYQSISFLFPGIERRQPSFFTRLNSHLLSEFVLMEQNRAIIVYPSSDDFVLSVVFFQMVEGIVSGDNLSDKNNIDEMKLGDKFFVGDAVVLYKKSEQINGKPYIGFGPEGKSTVLHPVEIMPRVEKAPAEAKVSSEKKFDEEYKRLFKDGVYQETVRTLADKIKRGRFAQNGAILIVSRDDQFTNAIDDFTIEGQKVTDLISVHKAKYDGTLKCIGRSGFSPQVIIAPTIPAAYVAATENKISGVYIDVRSLRTISEFENEIRAIIDEIKAPTFFFVPESYSLDISLLKDLGFEEFRWVPGMVDENVISNSDSSCQPFLKAISDLTVFPYCVPNPPLSSIFESLKRLEEEAEGTNQHITDSVALLIKYVFLLSRLCANLDENELNDLLERGEKVVGSMMSPAVFTYLDNQQLAKELNNIWTTIKNELKSKYPLKEVALVCELLAKKDFSEKDVVLVVPNDLNKTHVINSLNELMEKNETAPNLFVLSIDEFNEMSRSFDYVLTCGWLGKEKMRSILFSNVAQNYVPVLYDFELPWLKASVRRWNCEMSSSNLSHFIPEIEEPERRELSLDYSWFEEPAKPSEDVDYDDILQKTHKLQWHGYSEFQETDTKGEGRLISFSDGSYGVFSSGYSMTKIPMQEEQSLISVSANELCVGDIVVFGGSNHDLLVAESNKALRNEGHGDALAMAMSWRDSLGQAKNSGLSNEEIVDKLRACGVSRTDTTFRQWLDDESSVICPRNKEDLVKMGSALNDQILVDMANEIAENSKIVYKSRIITGKRLMKQLKENIDVAAAIGKLRSSNEFSSRPFVIDVAGIGTVEILCVVEVGEIGTYPQRIINQRKDF